MPRTKAEKKQARAAAIGRVRKRENDDRFAVQAAELAAAQATIAGLRRQISSLDVDIFSKDLRIAELESRCAHLQQQIPQPGHASATGQEQNYRVLQAGSVAMLPQPHLSTVSLVQPGVQQVSHQMQQSQQSSSVLTQQQHWFHHQ